MERAVAPAPIYRFGLFEADTSQNLLSRGGVRVKIQDQPFRVLVLLLERPAEIVTRDELRHQLWPEGTFVDFDGSLNVILKKLRAALSDDSDNPRFIETVPRHGYRFIAPVTRIGGETIPAAKLETAPGLVAEADAARKFSKPLAETRRQHVIRAVAFGLIAATVVVAGAAALLAWRHARNVRNEQNLTEPATPVVLRKSIAVLGFYNLTGKGEDAWLATAIAEMLNTELAAGDKLRLIAAEDVSHLRMTAAWPQSGALERKTTARLGTALNTDLLALGSYATLGRADRQQIRLDVRLQDARTGEVLTEVAEVGSTDNLFQVISRIGSKLRDRLHIPQIDYAGEAGVVAALPHDAGAAKFYSLGIEKLREFDALAAKDLLEQATRAEPKFALGHAMLAQAYGTLGYVQQHRAEARKAIDLAAGLPQPQQLLIEGGYYESLGNHEKAASVYHALFALYPDNVEYGLQLASEQRMAGHGSEGLGTIAELRKLPPPASEEPNIDLVEARIVPLQADALRLIRQALRKASEQGKRLVYAQARHGECIAIIYGENPQEGTASCEEAYRTLLAAGNRLDAADCVRLMADRLGAQGKYSEAVANYQNALALLKDLGDLEKTAAALNNMGEALMAQGKITEAEPLFERAKAEFSNAGDRGNAVIALTNIGDVLFQQGRLATTAATYQQAVEMLSTVDLGNPGYLLTRLADLRLAQGEMKDARRYSEAAVAAVQNQASDDLATALMTHGNLLMAQGDLAGARQQYQQSLEIRQKLNARPGICEAQQALAEAFLQEGHTDEAERELQPVMAYVAQQSLQPAAARAFIVLSKVLLAQGKIKEAEQAIAQAADHARFVPDAALRLSLDLEAARVRAAAGDNRTSVQKLNEVAARAGRFGFCALQSQARLAADEAELKTSPSVARQHLTELASEARGRGMELLARRAERLAN